MGNRSYTTTSHRKWMGSAKKKMIKEITCEEKALHATHRNRQRYLSDETQDIHIFGVCSQKVFGHQRTDSEPHECVHLIPCEGPQVPAIGSGITPEAFTYC